MALNGLVWPCMALYGLVWPCMALYGLVWHFMVFYGRITSFLAVIDPNSFDLVTFELGNSENIMCDLKWSGVLLYSTYIVRCTDFVFHSCTSYNYEKRNPFQERFTVVYALKTARF